MTSLPSPTTVPAISMSPTGTVTLRLIVDKQAEIAARVEGLAAFSAQLDDVRSTLEAAPPPPA